MGAETADSEQLPSRILMTTDAVGGIWRYSLDLVRVLGQAGTEVTLAVLGPSPSEEQRMEACAVPGLCLVEKACRLEWQPEPWPEVGNAGEWLLQIASDFKPDLVHLNGFALAALPWAVPVLVVAHSCVYSWWRAVHGTAPPEEWRGYHTRVRAGLDAGGAIATPSNSMAECLAREYGIDRRKIRVIHNFSRAAVREAGDKRPFALAAGRFWDAAKNLNLLREIAPQLRWPLLVAGDGEPSPGEPERGGLHLLGKIGHQELLDEMGRAAIFVHPARYEPFGLAVLEAAQRGCCLVLADIESLRELWGDAALFVAPDDTAGWIAALNRLSVDPKERLGLAEAARRQSARYRSSGAIRGYRELYAKLLTNAGNVAAA